MADQSSVQALSLELKVNGHRFEGRLPRVLRIRKGDPADRAFPAAVDFDLPGGTLLEVSRRLDLRRKTTTGFPGSRQT